VTWFYLIYCSDGNCLLTKFVLVNISLLLNDRLIGCWFGVVSILIHFKKMLLLVSGSLYFLFEESKLVLIADIPFSLAALTYWGSPIFSWSVWMIFYYESWTCYYWCLLWDSYERFNNFSILFFWLFSIYLLFRLFILSASLAYYFSSLLFCI